MQLTKEQEKIMLPNHLRIRVARMFRMLFSAKIPCPQIILEKEYEMIGEAIRDIRESDADIKILSDAELKEFFPDGLMASIDRIDSLPSPTLERKMEWRGDGDEICSINGIDLGRINYDPYGNISAIYTLSGERSKDADFGNAKLWVEQTVSSELNSLGSDGRILQAGTEQCVRFAQEVFNAIWPNGDIDGGHLQELGEQHGLLTPVKVTEPCGDACGCKDFINEAEFAEGHECFKKHSILLGKD